MLPNGTKKNSFAIDSATLKQVWGAVIHAISEDETRAPLLCVEIGEGFATATATDGHRLATVSFVGAQASCPRFLVDGLKFAALVKALPKGKNACEVVGELDEKALRVSFAGLSFELPRREGDYSYPEWSRIVTPRTNEKPDAVFGLNARYLSEACNAAHSFVGKATSHHEPFIEIRGSVDKSPCRIDAYRNDNVATLTLIIMPVRL